MQRVKKFILKELRGSGAIGRLARFFYRLISGAYFISLYYFFRKRRNIRGLRLHGVETLGSITAFCEKANIRPILSCGTLLSYQNDKGFSANSKDIDLCFLADDLKNPDLLIHHMEGNGYVLRVNAKLEGSLKKLGKHTFLQFYHPKRHVSVDIGFMHKYEDRLLYIEDRSCDYMYREFLRGKNERVEPYLGYCRIYRKEDFAELHRTTFEGCNVWLPRDPMVVLSISYGSGVMAGRKNIFSHLLLIREGTKDGAFEFIDPKNFAEVSIN